MNKRSVRKDRVGISSFRYLDLVTDKLATAASTYVNYTFYTMQNLFPSLQSANPRLARLRRVKIEFSPTEAALGVTDQQVAVQVSMLDLVTGNFVPVTVSRILSEVNSRTLSFTVPSEFSRWLNTTDAQKIIRIEVVNIASVATITNFTCKMTSELDLQYPVPTPV